MFTHQVAGAAQAAAELIGGEVSFAMTSPDDDPAAASGWQLTFQDPMSGETLAAIAANLGDEPVELLWTLLDALASAIPVTSLFWARPFPECDQHPHPAAVRMSMGAGGEPIAVALRCPNDDHLVRVITA
jgi:hypothetical protein